MGKIYSPQEVKVPCEVYSRVVGYIRPVNQWNPGKVAEFVQRKTFDSAFKAVSKGTENKVALTTKVEVTRNSTAVTRLD